MSHNIGRLNTRIKKSPVSVNVIEQREFPHLSADANKSSGSSRLSPKSQVNGRPAKGTARYPASSLPDITSSTARENPSKKPLARALVPFAEQNAACTGIRSSANFFNSPMTSDVDDRFMFVLEQFGVAHALWWANDNLKAGLQRTIHKIVLVPVIEFDPKQPSSHFSPSTKRSRRFPKHR